ncbi:mRNA capping enzyme, large subunit [Hesseltinella vesiculosa]|uniref:mRNA cap guanine-N(7) methyltransferase n=1 Tax=Hesseltinella vesiculosa TaxID=101127 RepID=A0A1X2G2M3_9FUNG|nr:mRNA capping enzyme, large subunit [Hesseltinella vesiculosa]
MSHPGSRAHLVAEHYNQRPEVGVVRRQDSRIIRLRSFNNWLKSVLIHRHARPNDCVLDLGCGKGGDLNKWAKAKIRHLIAADIAAVSLDQMKDRYQALRDRRFSAEFHALDCYGEELAPLIETHFAVDVVSMQFCMHYAFESERKARIMLENVTCRLRHGGHFIGTIPDANMLVKRLRAQPDDVFAFGNEFYWIDFTNAGLQPDKTGFESPYGTNYMFHLEDAVDCPEPLVHWETFERLAGDYGLRLLYKENFHRFYRRALQEPEYEQLLQRMRVVGGHAPDMSSEEWDVAGIYLAFAFVKDQ